MNLHEKEIELTGLEHARPKDGEWVSNADLESHLKLLGTTGHSKTNLAPSVLEKAFGWRVGSFKNEWALKLLRSGQKSKLPRGFVPGNRMFVLPQ